MNIQEYKNKYPSTWIPLYIPDSICGMLQFDETGEYFGGAFDGLFAYYYIKDYSQNENLLSYNDLIAKNRLNYYNIPYPSQNNYNHHAINEEQLQKRLDKLTKKELKLWKDNIKNFKITVPSKEKPVQFVLRGNDDGSYIKFFSNLNNALEELELFELLQPLNFQMVIHNNNFQINS